jgi:hypothetical protein
VELAFESPPQRHLCWVAWTHSGDPSARTGQRRGILVPAHAPTRPVRGNSLQVRGLNGSIPWAPDSSLPQASPCPRRR